MLLTLKTAASAVPTASLAVTACVPDTPEGFLPFGCVHLAPEEAGLFHVNFPSGKRPVNPPSPPC